jgi:hypothetical protein
VVQSSSPGVSAEALASLCSPDTLDTPFGTMEFFDGVPLPETVVRSYDALHLLRGVDVFLNCMPGASMLAMRNGLQSIGARSNVIACTDPRSTSAPVVLTANTETTYGTTFLDLKSDGPTVIECPPNSLSFVDDLWQRYVADMGNAEPDRGQGGSYLFLPPGHDSEVPDGYFVFGSPTYSNWVVIRALDGLDALLTTRIYPLAAADHPPETGFVNFAEASFNGIHANDFSFFEEVNEIIQEEPEGALDPERAGQPAAIGIIRGRPFEPDARRRDVLDRAARVGARDRPHPAVQATRPRRLHLQGRVVEDRLRRRQLRVPRQRGTDARLPRSDALRRHRHHPGDDPRRPRHRLPVRLHRRRRQRRHPRRRQQLLPHPPAPIPAKTFWAIDIYDTQTRSLLQTDNPYPSINDRFGNLYTEANGDVVIHFGPEPPTTADVNWLRTIPGKSWFPILRLYGPLQAWFDQTWQPGEIQPA